MSQPRPPGSTARFAPAAMGGINTTLSQSASITNQPAASAPGLGSSHTQPCSMEYSLLEMIRLVHPEAAALLEENGLIQNSAIESLSEEALNNLFPEDTGERRCIKALINCLRQISLREHALEKKQEEVKTREDEVKRREEEMKRREETPKRENGVRRCEQSDLISSQSGLRAGTVAGSNVDSGHRAGTVSGSHIESGHRAGTVSGSNIQSGYRDGTVAGSNIESGDGTSLMDQIYHISREAEKALHEAEITKDSEIQNLTREDLNELLPGLKNLKLRNIISEKIKTSLQSREEHSDEPMRDNFSPNPDSEESVKELFKGFLQAFDKRLESVYSSQNAALEECLTMFKKIQPSQPQFGTVNYTQVAEGKSTSRWSLSKKLSKECPSSDATNDYFRPSKLMKRAVVKVHCVVSGKTLDSHRALLLQVKDRGGLELQETNYPDTCDVIILFCPIVSRMGTDIEAAMKLVSGVGNKAIIRVLLHHTFDREYTVPHVSLDSRVMCNVNALFHDTQRGLLQCDTNIQAVQKIWDMLLKYSRNNS